MEDLFLESFGISIYRRVVLGGIFDRLYLGYKIFLGEGCLFVEENLIVGVIIGEMNFSKLFNIFCNCYSLKFCF